VRKIIKGDKNLIGVLTMAKDKFVEEIKKYDVEIIEVNEMNRNLLLNKKFKK